MSINFKKQKGDDISRVGMFRRPRALRVITGEGFTEQAHKDACDINLIIKRFINTGQIPPGKPGHFMDVSKIGDFQSSMDIVVAAQRVFEALPADVREKYSNDPRVYVKAMQDDFQKDEGVFKRKPKDIPDPVKDKDKGA